MKYLPEFNFKKEQSKIIVMDGLKIGKVYYLIAVSERDCIGYIKCKAENFTN
ncbi:hypothetical protein FACS189459_3390 [Bacilli bacterium]|nr:hypothetical protein FACS189459_3390 [Bacilli bacterium]